MLCLYLAMRPGNPAELVCTSREGMQSFVNQHPDTEAYYLGIADSRVPPAFLGTFHECRTLVTDNARKVEPS